jgi:hypothetical protein
MSDSSNSTATSARVMPMNVQRVTAEGTSNCWRMKSGAAM